jgi:hypothetical protein
MNDLAQESIWNTTIDGFDETADRDEALTPMQILQALFPSMNESEIWNQLEQAGFDLTNVLDSFFTEEAGITSIG